MESDQEPSVQPVSDASSPVKADVSGLSPSQIAAIKDDLVRAVIERAQSVEADAHSSHGNVHSSGPSM